MIVVCLACASQATAGMLIGSTFDAIYDIDPVTGVASNPRETGGRAFEIAFVDGILYGTAARILSTIDTASGDAQPLGTITGFEPFESIVDLSWNAQTDTLFGLVHLGGTTIDRLYTIDTSSLVATLIGEVELAYTTIAFDASGALFAVSRNPDVLSLIDPDRQLAGLGLSNDAIRSEDITEIQLLDHRPVLIAKFALAQPELEDAALIANGQERQLAHDPKEHNPPGHAGCDIATVARTEPERLRLPANVA